MEWVGITAGISEGGTRTWKLKKGKDRSNKMKEMINGCGHENSSESKIVN